MIKLVIPALFAIGAAALALLWWGIAALLGEGLDRRAEKRHAAKARRRAARLARIKDLDGEETQPFNPRLPAHSPRQPLARAVRIARPAEVARHRRRSWLQRANTPRKVVAQRPEGRASVEQVAPGATKLVEQQGFNSVITDRHAQ